MHQPPEKASDPLQMQVQHTLIEFLNLDLDLANTFMQTAITESHLDPDRCEGLLIKVGEALGAIRKLLARVADGAEQAKITARADELEAEFNEFRNRDDAPEDWRLLAP